MSKIRYVDIPSIIQVIGSIYQNPDILDNDQYSFTLDDFTEEFHQVIFGSIYNLHQLGAKQITSSNIEDYLEQRPKKLAVYKTNKGAEYLEKVSQNSQLAAFNYYYHRMKKMTLLRMFNEKVGLNFGLNADFYFGGVAKSEISNGRYKQSKSDSFSRNINFIRPQVGLTVHFDK